jgi:tetratricopeptide (TPR) repeat protein
MHRIILKIEHYPSDAKAAVQIFSGNNALMPNASEMEKILEACDADYAARAEPGRVLRIAERLRNADDATRSYDAQWRLARAESFLGDLAKSPEERRRRHQSGCAAGALAARLAPERVEGHLWRGINFGELAHSLPALLAIPAIMAARGALIRATKIDPTAHNGAAYCVMGRLARKSPPLLGGGFHAARTYFERSIAIAPENVTARLHFAELLADAGKADAAREQLQALLAAPDLPFWTFEQQRDRRLAQGLFDRLRDG